MTGRPLTWMVFKLLVWDMKTENTKPAGGFLFERFTRHRRPTVVHHWRRVYVGFWTALWLVGAMHCPLETLGVLPNDFCCLASPAAPADHGGPAKSGCSYEKSARWLISRADAPTLAPLSRAEQDFPPSVRPPAMIVVQPAKPDDETSFPPQTWQFHWRTALAPRAPTSLV